MGCPRLHAHLAPGGQCGLTVLPPARMLGQKQAVGSLAPGILEPTVTVPPMGCGTQLGAHVLQAASAPEFLTSPGQQPGACHVVFLRAVSSGDAFPTESFLRSWLPGLVALLRLSEAGT